MKYFSLYIVLVLLCYSCGDQSPVPEEKVYEIKNIGELSTTEYTVGKIIKVEDNGSEWNDISGIKKGDYKFGERKLLINCKAKIKAGVDLSKLKDGDIKISGTTIEITLPPLEITSFSMDPSLIRTEMESVTGLRDEFTQQEKNDFLKQGEEAIKKDITEIGIFKDAADNASAFITDFYQQLGFEKIIIHQTPPNDEK